MGFGMAGKDVCLLVGYAPKSMASPAAIRLANALVAENCEVRLCLTVNDEALPVSHIGLDAAVKVIVRRNGGYDFAAWADMLRADPQLWNARRLIFANDSLVGPFVGFPAMMRRLRASKADFVGLVESREWNHHFQSYFFAYQGRALKHPLIRQFWDGMPVLAHKRDVILQCELRLLDIAKQADLTTQALFPLATLFAGMEHELNPSTRFWERLLLAGFPFIKAETVGKTKNIEALTQMKVALQAAGADLAFVDAHMSDWHKTRGHVYRKHKSLRKRIKEWYRPTPSLPSFSDLKTS
jgi:lipopolysaccharide biosynthesis protein